MEEATYLIIHILSEVWDIVFQAVLLFLIYRLISTIIRRTSTKKQLPDSSSGFNNYLSLCGDLAKTEELRKTEDDSTPEDAEDEFSNMEFSDAFEDMTQGQLNGEYK